MNALVHIRHITLALACLMLTTVLSSNAAPADPDKPSKKDTKAAVTEKTRKVSIHRASELLDKKVMDNRGGTIGQIDEIVLTRDRNSVDYFVVALDDNEADRLALSPEKVTVGAGQQAVQLKQSQQVAHKECGFSGAALPSSRDTVKSGETLNENAAKGRQVSELIGMQVKDAQGHDAGEIEELLIDIDTGEIHSATISSGGVLGFNAKLNTIDWDAVQVHPETNVVAISETRQDLQKQAAGVTEYWQQFGFDQEKDTKAAPTKQDAEKKAVAEVQRDLKQAGKDPAKPADQPAKGMKKADEDASVERASSLMDMTVKNRQGESIGQVDDVVLSKDRDSIDYLAIVLDDAEDGTTRAALPLRQAAFAPKRDALILKSSKNALKEQRTFQDNKWPDSTRTPEAGKALTNTDATSRRLSKVVGMDVKGRDGKSIGTIEDLLINTKSGKITEATVKTSAAAGAEGKLVTVDWQSVKISPAEGVATLNKTQKELQSQAADAQKYWQQYGFEGEDGRTRAPEKKLETKEAQPKRGNRDMAPDKGNDINEDDDDDIKEAQPKRGNRDVAPDKENDINED